MKSIWRFNVGWILLIHVALLPAVGQTVPASASAAAPQTGPRIQFAETIHDFGDIFSANVIDHDFIYTNTGTAQLVITSVQPGCGCTVTTNWDRQVEPGKTGRIPVRFNPVSFSGEVTKSVTVLCNDVEQPTRILQFKAKIQHPFELLPASVVFNQVEGETTNETKSVRIINNLEPKISLETPISNNPMFTSRLTTIRPSKKFELQMSQSLCPTNARAIISIRTSSTNTPVLNVNAVLMFLPSISIVPQQLVLRPSAGTNQTYMVNIINNSTKPIELSEASVNAEGAVVTLHETLPGKSFSLRLDVPPEFQPTNRSPVALSLKTTSPSHPILRIPVVQPPPAAQQATNRIPPAILRAIKERTGN